MRRASLYDETASSKRFNLKLVRKGIKDDVERGQGAFLRNFSNFSRVKGAMLTGMYQARLGLSLCFFFLTRSYHIAGLVVFPQRPIAVAITAAEYLTASWAIDSEAMRARGIIVLVKSN